MARGSGSAPKQRSTARKALHGLKKAARKHHVIRRLKKYGPGVAATGVALAGIAAASYFKNPAIASGAASIGGAIEGESHKLQGKRPEKKGDNWQPQAAHTAPSGPSIADIVREQQAKEDALERNAHSRHVAASPMGSRTSRRS